MLKNGVLGRSAGGRQMWNPVFPVCAVFKSLQISLNPEILLVLSEKMTPLFKERKKNEIFL